MHGQRNIKIVYEIYTKVSVFCHGFCLSAAKNRNSFQLLPTSLVTDLLQPVLSLPLFLFPWGFHSRAAFGRARAEPDGTRAETSFRLSPKRTSPFKSAGWVSSVDCWQPRCAHQPLVMLDTLRPEVVSEYRLPTPFASFPFTSPPVLHSVPPHSERSILPHLLSLMCERSI